MRLIFFLSTVLQENLSLAIVLDDNFALSLFVASTFGSGGAPNSVKDLEEELRLITTWRHPPDQTYGR